MSKILNKVYKVDYIGEFYSKYKNLNEATFNEISNFVERFKK